MLFQGSSVEKQGISFLFLIVSYLLVVIGGLTLASLQRRTEKNDKDIAFE